MLRGAPACSFLAVAAMSLAYFCSSLEKEESFSPSKFKVFIVTLMGSDWVACSFLDQSYNVKGDELITLANP